MNCQEARNLVERVLDRNLSGGVKRRFDLHLSRCEECRAFFAAEQVEHQRWFKAVNSSDEPRHSLPPDFADRLVAAIAARSAVRRPFFMRLPRWALIAASLALMVGFVFATAVIVGRDAPIAPDGDVMVGCDVLIAADGDVTVERNALVAADGDVMVGRDALVAPPDNQLENTQGETVMTEKKVAAVALAATLTAAPLASSAVASCIVSGSTDRSAEVTSVPVLINSGLNTHVAPEVRLDGLNLRTDEPTGMIIVVR